jgi:Holliday junction resolvase
VCRVAGCTQHETSMHTIQLCERTHGSRVLRARAVDDILQQGLKQKGWEVLREPRILLNGRLHKQPDMIALNNGRAVIVDSSWREPKATSLVEKSRSVGF